MADLDPGLIMDLTEAKADLARHGVVIVRTVETDLVPAMMSEAKRAMASSPKSMARMDEDELDDFIDRIRKTSEKSVEQLRNLYVRLLAKLGSQSVQDVVKELDGIGELIKWDRVAKVVDPINQKLADKGFGSIELSGPEDLSESFRVELEEKWPASFDRFKELAREAARQIVESKGDDSSARPPRTKRAARKG